MNIAQELGDSELYNYDVLVKLLSDRFDPASRVSAFCSRFHGRLSRHHEDADAFADALAELCRVGYPQSHSLHHSHSGWPVDAAQWPVGGPDRFFLKTQAWW